MAEPLPIVLVHGAWHGAWCWAGLQAELDRRGLASYAIELPGHGASTEPLGDLDADVAHTVGALAALGARGAAKVILVGHSYGGAVITEAAGRAGNVAHLVYVTAFALEPGEAVRGLIRSLPPATVALSSGVLPSDNDTTVIDPGAAVAAFYAMSPPAAAAAAISRLSPQSIASVEQPVTADPRRTIDSTYVRCTLDEAIHIDHQDVMAARCRSVVTLECDHSPFLSMPAAVADVIEPIARR